MLVLVTPRRRNIQYIFVPQVLDILDIDDFIIYYFNLKMINV